MVPHVTMCLPNHFTKRLRPVNARIDHAIGGQSDVKMIHPTVVAVVGTEEGMECSSPCVAFEPVQCDKRLSQVAESAV